MKNELKTINYRVNRNIVTKFKFLIVNQQKIKVKQRKYMITTLHLHNLKYIIDR